MKILTRLLLILALCISCEDDKSTEIVISSGTSFGECMGYCKRELIVDEGSVSYSASSWGDPDYPTIQYESSLSSTEWNDLIALADLSALQEYEDIVGCPDCADGGAEWIQIDAPEGIKKIIFEYGDSLGTIQPLIVALRDLRADYEEELFNK